MKQIEKIQALADKHNINIATNLGLNEMMKLILAELDDEEIQHFYIDTFMCFEDTVSDLYDETREKTDDELRDEAECDRHEYERGN